VPQSLTKALLLSSQSRQCLRMGRCLLASLERADKSECSPNLDIVASILISMHFFNSGLLLVQLENIALYGVIIGLSTPFSRCNWAMIHTSLKPAIIGRERGFLLLSPFPRSIFLQATTKHDRWRPFRRTCELSCSLKSFPSVRFCVIPVPFISMPSAFPFVPVFSFVYPPFPSF
jgi:hypothetical protein